MSDDSIRWLIRTKDGLIEGPFETLEIVYKIRTGYYLGEESISLYPSGRWQPISYEEDFFNELLETLEDELSDKPSKSVGMPSVRKKTKVQSIVEKNTGELRKRWGEKAISEDPNAPAPPENNDDGSKTLNLAEQIEKGRAIDEREDRAKKKLEKEKEKAQKKLELQQKSLPHDRDTAIKSRRKRKPPPPKKSNKGWAVLMAIAVALLLLFIMETDPGTQVEEGARHLLRPQWGKKSQQQTPKKALDRAIAYFRRDQVRYYYRAQEVLVGIVEGSRSLDAYSFLCMVYRELWPISLKDTQDLETIKTVLRKVQKMSPQSVAAKTCLAVSHLAEGKYDDAARIMEAQLRIEPSLIFFNQMSGDIHASKQEYDTAAYYFSKVRELWQPPPAWAKTILQEARMYRRLKQHGDAVTLYRGLLKVYPRHAVGQIEYGILEYHAFQHINRAKGFIISGLKENQQIPRPIESEAYLVLSTIYSAQGGKKKALTYAKKSFSIDSTNRIAKERIIKLGGEKALNNVEISNLNLVYEGEQYMKMGNYTKAQARFRGAFETDRSNAFAALRAGQALWKLNQSDDAIGWVQKAATADPMMIRVYFVLSDYLSQRYDYLNAVAALKQARRINKNHHGVWRGLALVEYRRRNYEGAIRYALRALKVYDTDIESLLLLALSNLEVSESSEAMSWINRALELDQSNEEVQAAYTKILTAVRGAVAGENYIQNLIDQMPNRVIFHRTKAEIYIGEQNYNRALNTCNEILTIEPNDKLTLMMMARILQLQSTTESFDEAREFLMAAASLDPSDAEPLFQLGELYLASNQSSFAMQQFKRVLKVNSKYPLANYKLGQALVKMKKYDEALERAKIERNLNPEIPESFLLAGEANFRLSIDTTDPLVASSYAATCATEYRLAIGKGYRTANGYLWLARCLRLSGALDPAESMLDEATTLESGNPEVYKEFGALHEVRGDNPSAVFAYEKYLKLSKNPPDFQDIKNKVDVLKSK